MTGFRDRFPMTLLICWEFYLFNFFKIFIKFRTVTCTEKLKIKKNFEFIFSRGCFSKNLFSWNVFVSSYFTLQPWQGTVLFTSIRYHNNQLLRYLGVWEPLHLLLNRTYKMGTDNFYMQLTSCLPYFYPSYPLPSILPLSSVASFTLQQCSFEGCGFSIQASEITDC